MTGTVTLRNRHGMAAKIAGFGGTLMELLVPDRNGRLGDVVLGFDTVDRYRAPHPFFGALIGRFGNRIAKGRFEIDGKTHQLDVNDGPNHLHGGPNGFHAVEWKIASATDDALAIEHQSPDGAAGYPGNLSVNVTYSLGDDNSLRLDYFAVTDAPTIVNLTHHAYFNLAGASNGDILGHELFIRADYFTPTDAGLIPTGDLRAVKGTAFDFWRQQSIGARIDDADEQLRFGKGYDHNFVLANPNDGLRLVARVRDNQSGRTMEVVTTERGLQFYSGNQLDGSVRGKGGVEYGRHAGFCLETQRFPDSPNRPSFPSARLDPGSEYRSTTIYKFSAD